MVRVFIQHVKALARLQAPAAHACDSSTQQTEGGPEVPHPRYIVSSNPPGLHEPLSQKAGGGGGINSFHCSVMLAIYYLV